MAEIDVKSTAEALKTLIKLSSIYASHIKGANSNSIWLELCINFLVSAIINGIEHLSSDKEKTDRELKISGFYLQILQKLTLTFEREYFCGHECLIQGLIDLLNIEQKIEKPSRLQIVHNTFTIELWKIVLFVSKTEACVIVRICTYDSVFLYLNI